MHAERHNVVMTRKQAEAIAGKLGNPSKMPGTAYGLPAAECATGAKLRQIAGSTCASCYALRGNYTFGNVQRSQYARLGAISHPLWVPAMVVLLRASMTQWHRWHDSGDLQSLQHLERIADVCDATPAIRHWLPTRERGIVAAFLRKHGKFPANLVVRLSAAMVDGPAPTAPHTSTVTSNKDAATCPAPPQGNVCGECRACWDSSVANVSYAKH